LSYSATRASTTSTEADPEQGGAGGGTDDSAYPRDLDELHSRCVRWFEEAERATWDEREQSEQARDYKSGIQWTRSEIEAMRARHQPVTTINHVSRKIELLCGLERKARTDPKAFPRTPTEEGRADAATQVLRYVTDDCDFPIIRSAVYENMLVEGFGGALIDLEDDGQGGADIVPRWVAWDRLWRDPHSRMPDFSDARYKGLVLWMDRDQLEEMYPDVEDVTADSFASHSGTTYDDRPGSVSWQDSTRQRCRVAQCHWSEKGEWWEVTYTRAGILVPPQRSPLKDRKGKAACRLIMQSAYVDRENKRFGIVRDLISPQDEINKRRSKALHLLSVRQVIAEKGAVADVDDARREVAKPDGYVEVRPGLKFEIAQTADLADGQMKLLEHATQEMQASGPNASLMGTDSKELSGRAILANQAGGQAQNEPVADALRFWSRSVYEMIWMGVRQYWTAEKWVRVTDDLGSIKWVGINRQVTLQDELASMPEQQRAMAMQQMQLQPNDPRLQQVIRVENDVSDLDVDITIEEGQNVPTLMAEDFQALVQLASIQPGLIPGEVLIAASSLRNKDKLLEMMKVHQQQQQQVQQQAGQLAQQHAEADIKGKQAKAAADAALAKERTVNAARNLHDVHADFSAPPYGQSWVAPDASSGPMGAPEPQMHPEMKAAHDLADLRAKHAKAAVDEAKVVHTRNQAVGEIANTHNTMVTTNRLIQTPIPQPAPPGGAP
jgi:hypothetical protein